MRARAGDDLAIGVDESVRFARKRRDLDRKGSLEPFRPARADRGQTFGDAFERRQAETHLERGGQQQHDREYSKGKDERAVEAVYLLVDLRRVAGHGDEVTPFLAKIDRLFNDAQPLPLGPFHVTLARAA